METLLFGSLISAVNPVAKLSKSVPLASCPNTSMQPCHLPDNPSVTYESTEQGSFWDTSSSVAKDSASHDGIQPSASCASLIVEVVCGLSSPSLPHWFPPRKIEPQILWPGMRESLKKHPTSQKIECYNLLQIDRKPAHNTNAAIPLYGNKFSWNDIECRKVRYHRSCIFAHVFCKSAYHLAN
jgi:hypothetical protein